MVVQFAVRRRLVAVLAAGAVVVTGGAIVPDPAFADSQDEAATRLRIGVLALASSVAAVGQTPELSTPLPLTTTSLADVLEIDRGLTENLTSALQGTDIQVALRKIEGITVLPGSDDETIRFTYDRDVTAALPLVHDDGDLRFGANSGAGSVHATLTTDPEQPFVVAVDPTVGDPLLSVALVGKPLMRLSVDIDTPALAPFTARQGFTEVDVDGGHYRLHRDQDITMRDPDGRGVLTLEDLRYSTLPDLFSITTSEDQVDVALDLALPDTVGGGTDEERSGRLVLLDTDDDPGEWIWPSAADADRTYGSALRQATDLSMVDGVTALAQYTGSVLALQDSADVPFPQLDGGTSDVFAPGDDLLDLLSTAASARVVCGPSEEDPSVGVSAPGEAVWCQAVTAEGLGDVTGITWSLPNGGGTIDPAHVTRADTVGTDPGAAVRITGTDGEPDVQVSFTAGEEPLVARTMPRTVQDVLERVGEIDGSTATAALDGDRLDVDLAIRRATVETSLPLGGAASLGALVGLTGLRAPRATDPDGDPSTDDGTEPDPALAQVEASGASFDVGFGIQTGTPADGAERATYLLPQDRSLLEIDDLDAGDPTGLTGLDARIGFLGVTADVGDLDLGRTGTDPVVSLDLAPTLDPAEPLEIESLFGEQGALDPDVLDLTSSLTAGIDFTAREKPVSAGTYAVGTDEAASGTVSVRWSGSGLPEVVEDAGYAPLRVFDPVPARFLSGTARHTTDADGLTTVLVDVDSLAPGEDLYTLLNVAPPAAGAADVEVTRGLMADGLACQTVILRDADTLTCEGLAPGGVAAVAADAPVRAVVLGDPFALRDSVVEGLASTLAEIGRLTSDNVDDPATTADQYTSTLPLVGLVPDQLAVERVALRDGLAAIDAAATEDEAGASATPVSTVQELTESVPTLVKASGKPGDYRPTLDLDLGSDTLRVSLVAHSPETVVDGATTPTTVRGALRFFDEGSAGAPGRGQVASSGDATVPVSTDSTTTLAITVDRATGRAAIAGSTDGETGTGTTSTATLTRSGTDLAGHGLSAGVAALTAVAGSTADLGVTVRTGWVESATGGRFETRRSNARGNQDAAAATLALDDGTTLTYAGEATDSSGGDPTAQPAPDPMQVAFLAEGLDGLAVALGSAMDGAAPRNLVANDGAPISLPLLGSDLDGDADVEGVLTALTSSLRTQLAAPAVSGLTDAGDLQDALEAAALAANDATTGLVQIGTDADRRSAAAISASVVCAGGDATDDACEPCPAPTTKAGNRSLLTTTTAPEPEPSTDPSGEPTGEPTGEPSTSSSSDPSGEPSSSGGQPSGSSAGPVARAAEPSAPVDPQASEAATDSTQSASASAEPSGAGEPSRASESAEPTDAPETTDAAEPTQDAEATEGEPTDGTEAAQQRQLAAAAAEPVCETYGPTGWDTVELNLTVTGTPREDKPTPFQTGLAGVEVRSDKEITSTTSWTLPITLRLVRGVGPQVVVGADQALALDVSAEMPAAGIDAIVGYLPAHLSATGTKGRLETTRVTIAPAKEKAYDLFDLYGGELEAVPSLSGPADEDGIALDFATLTEGKDAQGKTFKTGVLGLSGTIALPWTADGGFGTVSYDGVSLDLGAFGKTVATPFQVVDPYLAPVRDVVDVLRSPIPVVSDLSELAGGDEVTLLSLLVRLSKAARKPQLELVDRVTSLVQGATKVVADMAKLSEKPTLEDLSAAGSLLTIEPSDVALYDKCTETITTSATATTPRKKTTPEPCGTAEEAAKAKKKAGAPGQTAADTRTGTRKPMRRLDEKTRSITGSMPGFSLPFLADPDQLTDMLTGEGEASYFRIDLGTLAAEVAYRQTFGPIMAGPIPIAPFVGGSISIEGRLAMGFDSLPQTLAAEGVNPGAVDDLVAAYSSFDGGDIFREGFYLDDLDAEGVDVPEVQLVTTLEAGAGVSIGIVSAGLKGSVTLTINLDLNDPDDDGRIRTAEIRSIFAGKPQCIFDASAEIEAAISVYVQIELLFTSLEYDYDILRLGPYELFKYGCPDVQPKLVVQEGNALALTSGKRHGSRFANAADVADDYEVRQFRESSTRTTYEVSGSGRVQTVVVTGPETGPWDVRINKSGLTVSTEQQESFTTSTPVSFRADGGGLKDTLSFLPGEKLVDAGTPQADVETTPFSSPVVELTGGDDDDALVAGAGDDSGIDGGPGNDSITTGAGTDVATGGAGNDTMNGGAGRDDLRGGDGTDRVQGGPGADRVDGEAGNDSLVGGTGRDVRALLVRPLGAAASAVADQVRLGFDSGDVVVGGPGVDAVDGGDGSDVVVGGSAPGLTGTPGSPVALDSLLTTTQRTVNVLREGAPGDPNTIGVETVTGVETAKVPDDAALDTLCLSGTAASGTTDSDFVTGGPEKDVVVGGDGPDTLDGGSGPDEICGRAGDDQISGDAASAPVTAPGTAGTPTVVSGATDADVIRGGAGDDRVESGPGDDVVFGDDVTLRRGAVRVLDGTLAGTGSGSGLDFLDGGDGDDVLAGGGGADLLLGGAGDDATFGEARDTADAGGDAPDVADRLLACNPVTRVVGGGIDLNGDLLASDGSGRTTRDTGRLAGLPVVSGTIIGPGGAPYDGLLGGELSVVGGRVDLDRDGALTAADTGSVDLASMLSNADNAQGDCVLAGDGDDQLGGGAGSDYLGAGDGVDLADGGDGNDLLLGDAGTDVLLGGPHHDVLVGGEDADSLVGGDGDDRLRGNEGADDLVGGSATDGATDGQDVLLGGAQEDVLVAENGQAVSQEIVSAIAAAGVRWLPAAPAAVTATTGSSLVFTGSAVRCASAEPARWLTVRAEDTDPGTPLQSPGTPLAYDELYGGSECDVVLGSSGDDVVRGGQGDDLVEGGPGADVAQGDDGDDVVVGGSSWSRSVATRFTTTRTGGAGSADGGDTILGDGGPDGPGGDGSDLVAGDNALPERVSGPTGNNGDGPSYVLTLHDVATTSSTPDAATGGADRVNAGGADDRVFAQGGDDVVTGGDGQDQLEGNAGADDLTGGTGDDDLVGGSSAADGRPLGTDGSRSTATLAGPFDSSAAGLVDGGDVVDQGGADGIDAGSADDHVEGNEGGDTLTGGLGSDTVIGGSSLSPDGRGTLDDARAAARTQLDGGDVIRGDLAGSGETGSDLITGDNATVLSVGGRRVVQLADVATTTSTPAPLTSGGDVIDGGTAGAGQASAGDRVFGQGGNDTVTTGAGDDTVEGGAGDDTVTTGLGSGDGDDDVLGGSSALDGRPLGDTGTRLVGDGDERQDLSGPRLLDGRDTIDAGAGDDVVLGDNGLLTRPAGAGTTTRLDGTRLRTVRLWDVATSASGVVPGVGGSDRLTTGDGEDLAFGQVGDDVLVGDAGEDYLEGNAGSDALSGGAGEDDLLGGGSTTNGAVVTVSGGSVSDRLLEPLGAATDPSAAGQLDGNDTLDGGDARDVLLGDNGRITRDGLRRLVVGGASGPHVARQVAMADQGQGLWAGSDTLLGGLGDDDLYGQLDATLTTRAKTTYQGQRVVGDVLDGGAGDDALLGDQGVSVATPAATLGAPSRTVRDAAGFIRELVRPTGTLVRVVTQSQSRTGGDDVLLGGDGTDSLHSGAGKDQVNAGAGDDVVFGGDGSDALWGGTGHDRVFGGAGSDLLDIKKRARDPLLWHLVAPSEDTDGRRRTDNGTDVLYGGSGADGLQADRGDEGTSRRVQGDRLIDWSRSINHYEVCRSGYGSGRVSNTASSSMIAALRQLAAATGSVGPAELAVPGPERLKPYRDGARFVCETR